MRTLLAITGTTILAASLALLLIPATLFVIAATCGGRLLERGSR